jgi:hypothetical protein
MEESMSDLYFSTNVGNEITLCIAPLTSASARANGMDDHQVGYFLFEKNHSEDSDNVAVIAHLQSEEAALRLSRLLGME